MPVGRFVRELRRRRVFRTAGLYVVGAWMLMQVADVFFPGTRGGAPAGGLLRRTRGERGQAPEPKSLELPLPGGGAPPTDRLVVQTGRGTSVLRFDQIDYLEAARNYVSVHADGREYVVRDTMANLSEKLAPGPFVRTHRSYIVNADKITEILTADARQRIVLRSGTELPLSRSYREAVERVLSGGAR